MPHVGPGHVEIVVRVDVDRVASAVAPESQGQPVKQVPVQILESVERNVLRGEAQVGVTGPEIPSILRRAGAQLAGEDDGLACAGQSQAARGVTLAPVRVAGGRVAAQIRLRGELVPHPVFACQQRGRN